MWMFFIPFLVSAQVDSGYVDIKGGELFYRVFGSGEPLVFLNGGPGYASDGYEFYAKELSQTRQVILFDQRGTGRSELKWVNNISIEKMVDDVEILRKHLQIDKWDVVGHSFGGIYSMHYAAKHGDKINKLVLSASPSFKTGLSQMQEFRNVEYESIAYLVELEEFEYLKEAMLKENPSEEIIMVVRRLARAKYYTCKQENYLITADWFANKCNPSVHVTRVVQASMKKTKLKENHLKNFTNPVLIVHGSSDFLNISNPLSNHEVFPNSKLEIIYNSGHMMSLDQPEKYFSLIKEFLKNTKD